MPPPDMAETPLPEPQPENARQRQLHVDESRPVHRVPVMCIDDAPRIKAPLTLGCRLGPAELPPDTPAPVNPRKGVDEAGRCYPTHLIGSGRVCS
jgi:hypothetical protein